MLRSKLARETFFCVRHSCDEGYVCNVEYVLHVPTGGACGAATGAVTGAVGSATGAATGAVGAETGAGAGVVPVPVDVVTAA